jgi:hypothetical protein
MKKDFRGSFLERRSSSGPRNPGPQTSSSVSHSLDSCFLFFFFFFIIVIIIFFFLLLFFFFSSSSSSSLLPDHKKVGPKLGLLLSRKGGHVCSAGARRVIWLDR